MSDFLLLKLLKDSIMGTFVQKNIVMNPFIKSMALSSNSIFLFLILIVAVSCKKDDADMDPAPPTSYDASSHVYATMIEVREGTWETIIDLETGKFRRIEETKSPGSSIEGTAGTTEMIDFINNRRIYKDPANGTGHIVVQDLETFESTTIDLFDSDTGRYLTLFGDFYFGPDNEYIYGLTSAYDAYKVDLDTKEVKLIKSLRTENIKQVQRFIYLQDRDQFLTIGNSQDVEDSYAYSLYDIESQSVLAEDIMPRLFGFAVHPNNDQIYALTYPTDDRKFRMVEITVNDNGLQIRQKSSSDLAIDELSTKVQTIHTATNSYICRGGSTAFEGEGPENTLYSIDLNTGNLKSQVFLEDYKNMLGINGE